MFKTLRLKEEDYWLYPIMFVNMVTGGLSLYASVLTFRLPAIVLFACGFWFTFNKIRRDYSLNKARLHVFNTVAMVLLFTLAVYSLTN